MKQLLEEGADPNARVITKVWYSDYNFDQSGVDEAGATPFWRAAYGADVDAMKLLVSYGADPLIPTTKPPERPRDRRRWPRVSRRTSRACRRSRSAVPASRRCSPRPASATAKASPATRIAHAPGGMLAAVKYLVEELGADVNARDHEGNTAAAPRRLARRQRDDSLPRHRRAPT